MDAPPGPPEQRRVWFENHEVDTSPAGVLGSSEIIWRGSGPLLALFGGARRPPALEWNPLAGDLPFSAPCVGFGLICHAQSSRPAQKKNRGRAAEIREIFDNVVPTHFADDAAGKKLFSDLSAKIQKEFVRPVAISLLADEAAGKLTLEEPGKVR